MLVTQLGLIVFLTWPPLAPERNGTRTLLPMLALALVAPGDAGPGRPDDQSQVETVATTSSWKRSTALATNRTGSTSSLRARGVRSIATITSSASSAARGSKNVALAMRRPREATS